MALDEEWYRTDAMTFPEQSRAEQSGAELSNAERGAEKTMGSASGVTSPNFSFLKP